MRYIFTLCALACLNMAAAQSFEGIVSQKVQDFEQGAGFELNWVLDGDNAAIELVYHLENGGTSTMVLLPLANGTYAYFNKESAPSGKNYYYVGMEGEDDGLNYQMVRTKATSNTKNYNTEEFIFKSGLNETQVWFSEDLNIDFSKMVSKFNSSGFFTKFPELPAQGFVLDLIEKEKGVLITSIELLKVEEKPIPDNYFEIPAGYEQYTGQE